MGQGFWALMDQGLFAVSNFTLNILLARWLTQTDYGAFSAAYSIFLLLGTFHTAIFTEPMLVYGSGKYSDVLSHYLRILLRGHWLFGALSSSLFAIAGLWFLVYGQGPLTPAILGLAVASPFILFQWLMRRACYVNFQPRLAAYAGVLYTAIMTTGIVGLNYFDQLGAFSSLIVVAAASLASGLWLTYQLTRMGPMNPVMPNTRLIINDHWKYGRWAIGSALVMWVPGNSFLLFLPHWWGLEAAATYRALLNLLLPVMNVTMALSRILLPTLVRIKDKPNFYRQVLRATLLLVIAPILYWSFLNVFGDWILQILYGDKYLALSWLLLPAGAIPVVAAVSNAMSAALRALELPNRVFVAYSCSAIVALTGGVVLIRASGVEGAILGWLLAYIVTMVVMCALLAKRQIHEEMTSL